MEFATKPKYARSLFQMRPIINGALVLVIFTSFAIVFSFFPWACIGDILLIGALYYLFFHVMADWTAGIRCPQCQKYVATNTPWTCGFCKKDNRRVGKFPFIHQCEHCEAAPKSYKCHHCQALIFFTEDELAANAATCVGLTEAVAKDEEALRKKAKVEVLHEIEMTELATKLEQSKQMQERGKKKSPLEEIEDSFNRNYARVMGSHEFARRQKAVNAEKFKDDPEMLARANEFIDDWLRGRL